MPYTRKKPAPSSNRRYTAEEVTALVSSYATEFYSDPRSQNFGKPLLQSGITGFAEKHGMARKTVETACYNGVSERSKFAHRALFDSLIGDVRERRLATLSEQELAQNRERLQQQLKAQSERIREQLKTRTK